MTNCKWHSGNSAWGYSLVYSFPHAPDHIFTPLPLKPLHRNSTQFPADNFNSFIKEKTEVFTFLHQSHSQTCTGTEVLPFPLVTIEELHSLATPSIWPVQSHPLVSFRASYCRYYLFIPCYNVFLSLKWFLSHEHGLYLPAVKYNPPFIPYHHHRALFICSSSQHNCLRDLRSWSPLSLVASSCSPRCMHFHCPYSILLALVRVTNGLHVAKFCGHFLGFILLHLFAAFNRSGTPAFLSHFQSTTLAVFLLSHCFLCFLLHLLLALKWPFPLSLYIMFFLRDFMIAVALNTNSLFSSYPLLGIQTPVSYFMLISPHICILNLV